MAVNDPCGAGKKNMAAVQTAAKMAQCNNTRCEHIDRRTCWASFQLLRMNSKAVGYDCTQKHAPHMVAQIRTCNDKQVVLSQANLRINGELSRLQEAEGLGREVA